MPRGKKANAGTSLDALKAQLKTQYDENVKAIDGLQGKDAGEDDGDDVKEAIKLLRTLPVQEVIGNLLPYIKLRIRMAKDKGRIGTKKPKPSAAATPTEKTAPATGANQ